MLLLCMTLVGPPNDVRPTPLLLLLLLRPLREAGEPMRLEEEGQLRGDDTTLMGEEDDNKRPPEVDSIPTEEEGSIPPLPPPAPEEAVDEHDEIIPALMQEAGELSPH